MPTTPRGPTSPRSGGPTMPPVRGSRAVLPDRFRLPRRADPLLLAQRQLAIWHRRHLRVPQGQLLLLQGMVGQGTDAASFSPLNWAGKEGEEISVWVHSNLESVELLCNGRASAPKVEPLHHLEWKVKYVPGYIEARGTKGSKVYSSQSKKLPGPQRRSASRPIARSSPPMEKIWRWYAWKPSIAKAVRSHRR